MDRPDLPLNALRVFEVAMRQGSFTKAAIELRVTQAAVSHQVSRLEDLLGTVLFLRTSQGLVPTDEGKLLFPVLGRGFDAMARVQDQLGGRRDIEVLNIGVNTTFALGWLMPRIALFRKEHPEIDLRISTNNNRVEILREGLDMAIRFGNGGWTGHEEIPLVEAPLAPLCAPALTARLPHPSDLAQVTLLRSYRSAEWTQWFDAAGTDCPPLTGPVFDSSVALAELAASGADYWCPSHACKHALPGNGCRSSVGQAKKEQSREPGSMQCCCASRVWWSQSHWPIRWPEGFGRWTPGRTITRIRDWLQPDTVRALEAEHRRVRRS